MSERNFRLAPRLRAVTAVLFLSGAGCATAEVGATAVEAFSRGDLSTSLATVNDALGVAGSDDTPRTLSADRIPRLLDRASILEASGRYGSSARDFALAADTAELLDASAAPDELAAAVYPRGRGSFHATATELLAARSFEMLDHLLMGDMSEARRAAQKFTRLRNHLYRTGADVEHASIGSYLAGFIHEKAGNPDTALAYYDEALRKRDFSSLLLPIKRVASRTTHRGDHVMAYLPPAAARGETVLEPETANAELLVVVKVGRAPTREVKEYPLAEALGRAGAYAVGERDALKRTGHTFVRAPALVAARSDFDRVALRVDGKEIRVELASDLARELRTEHHDMLPKVLGGALARMMSNEGPTWSDRPDTRSWAAMPARVFVARVELPAGAHQVEVALQGPGGQDLMGTHVDVPDGGFAAVDFTTLR